MSKVSSQIQRANTVAVSDQLLPQIQASLKSGLEHGSERRWQDPARRLENRSGEALGRRFRSDYRDECHRCTNRKKDLQNTYDLVTRDSESPNIIPEILTGRISLRSALNQPPRDHNDPLDTTLPATEQTSPVAVDDPIKRLAYVLTNLQNRPTAQQLTIRPVNSNTMTFDGKREKIELLEDLFHTMIKMQPEISEQMKINNLYSLLRKGALQTFKNISTINRQTLEDVLVISRRTWLRQTRVSNIIGTVWYSILTRRGYQNSSNNSIKGQKKRLATRLRNWLKVSSTQNCHGN